MNPITNPSTRVFTRVDAEREIKKELGMRRKVWGMADRNQEKFVKLEHQRRYDVLKDLQKVLGSMTDAQWIKFLKLASRMEEAKLSQTKLFE